MSILASIGAGLLVLAPVGIALWIFWLVIIEPAIDRAVEKSAPFTSTWRKNR